MIIKEVWGAKDVGLDGNLYFLGFESMVMAWYYSPIFFPQYNFLLMKCNFMVIFWIVTFAFSFLST